MDVTEEVNNAILQSKNIKLDPERQLPIVEWDESDGVMVGDACKQSMGWRYFYCWVLIFFTK